MATIVAILIRTISRPTRSTATTGIQARLSDEFRAGASFGYLGIGSGWNIHGRGELNFRSSTPGDLEGVAATELGLPRFPYIPPAYAVVNLRAGLGNDRFEIGAFVENLTKTNYYTGTQDNFGLGGIRLRPHPRIIGVTGKIKFGS